MTYKHDATKILCIARNIMYVCSVPALKVCLQNKKNYWINNVQFPVYLERLARAIHFSKIYGFNARSQYGINYRS